MKCMNTTFVSIGSMNGQKQTHRNEKSAPASRGIWLLPQKLGRDLKYLGYGNWIPSERISDKKFMRGKIHKMNLSVHDTVWHHIYGTWEKCSFTEHFSIVYKFYGKLYRRVENRINSGEYSQNMYYLDGEQFEVFYEC